MNYDDDQSYQDQLDSRFYKGKKPSDCVPYTLKDICEATVQIIRRILRPEYFTAFVFFFTHSIKLTCLFCKITRRTFYYHIRYLQTICPQRRKRA